MKANYFQCPQPTTIPASSKDKRLAFQGKAHDVTYPVSYRYNGGIVIKDQWYAGYEVPPPEIPQGWQLADIGVGLQLNAKPPYATMRLEPIA